MVTVGWHFVFGLAVEVMKLMQRKESSVNDSCLASVEGTIERTLEFQVVIEHTTSLKPVGCSNHSAARTRDGFTLWVNENPAKRLGSPSVPVVHWLKHPIGVKEVVGSSFIWNSKYCSVVFYPLPSNHHLHHMSTGAFKTMQILPLLLRDLI